MWIADFTRNQAAQARTALSAATAVGNQDIGGVCAHQDGLLRATIELIAAGLDGDLEATLCNGLLCNGALFNGFRRPVGCACY
jgi:hypothetical protein